MKEKKKFKGRMNKTGRGFLVTTGLILLTKLKWILAILKLSKFGFTLISLIISLAGYAMIFGWRFAIALVYLLFIHETGHLIAAKIKGIKTSPAVFIPFMGAVIGMKEQPKHAATEAFLAYGGPLGGLVSIIPAMLLYWITGAPIWALVTMLGSLLNLFNLFPVSPLDGGRIVGVLSTKIWFVGLLVMIPILFMAPNPVLILIFIFGFLTWWKRARESFSQDLVVYEKDQRKAWTEKLQTLKRDFFYEVTQEYGSELFVNSGMKLFYMREFKHQINVINDTLASMRKFYVPFIEDRHRLKREKLIRDSELLSEMGAFVQSVNTPEDFDRRIQQMNKDVASLEKRWQQTLKYYEAKAMTKWKILLAYLSLAIVLSVIYLYSKQIMDFAQPIQPYIQ